MSSLYKSDKAPIVLSKLSSVVDNDDDEDLSDSLTLKDSNSDNAEWQKMRVGGNDNTRQSSVSRSLAFVRDRVDFTALFLAFLVFLIVTGAGVALTLVLSNSAAREMEAEATDIAVETSFWFSSELDRALTPLFSLAQFVTQIDEFRNLPEYWDLLPIQLQVLFGLLIPTM